MKIPRLYFDTSVFGGVYDIEFIEIKVKASVPNTIIKFKSKASGITCCHFNSTGL